MNPRLVAASLLLLGCRDPRDVVTSSGGAWLTPTWASEDGFIEIVPPIALPETPSGALRATVYARIPEGSAIDLGPEGSLVYPAGTVVDRVERRRTPAGDTVADVRGTRFEADGSETFRAFRPWVAELDSPLFGYEWPRAAGASEATRFFEPSMRDGHGFAEGEPGALASHRQHAIERYASILDCASCHAHDEPEAAPNASRHLRRGTDGGGLYTLAYALRDHAPLETYRPSDPNAEDPYVSYTCEGEPAMQGARGTTQLRCADGSIPTLVHDTRRALREGEPHARALCATRRALAEHMTPRARQAFRDALLACDQ